METWILYDKNRKETGKIVPRNTFYNKGEYHVSVHAWIKINDKFLIFQRGGNKKQWANLYEPIGGGMNGNEGSLAAVIREVKEESGLDVKEGDIQKFFTVINEENFMFPEFCDVYIFNANFKLSDVKISETENYNPQLLTLDEIKILAKENKLLPLVTYINKL